MMNIYTDDEQGLYKLETSVNSMNDFNLKAVLLLIKIFKPLNQIVLKEQTLFILFYAFPLLSNI